MKCIKCGKREAKIGYLCEECYNEEHELFKLKPFTVTICPSCNRYKIYEWKDSPNPIKSAVAEKIKPIGIIKDISTKLEKVGGRTFVSVKAVGYIPPSTKPKIEVKRVEIKIKKNLCPICVKKSGNYHEAVIQVRGDNREKLLKIILDSQTLKNNVVNVKNLKEGYDIFVVDKKIAEERVKKIHGITMIKSYKLVGKKKGRELYRNYYAVRWLDGRRTDKNKATKRK